MATKKQKAFITAAIANPEVAKKILDIIDWYEAGGGGGGGSVTSVNGETGTVVLTTDDISEGVTNKYYTDARAKSAAVVNNTVGNETDKAASVAAMKAYVAANEPDLSDYYDKTETDSLLAAKANDTDLDQEITDRQTADALLIPLSQKGANNGVATLDAGGKVPVEQLPNSVMTYEGTWNASTNTPVLVNGTGDAGSVYIVSDAGTHDFGAGPITFAAGDWVVYSGSIWQKSTSSAQVVSVNGQQGIVVLTTDEVAEGTKKYYATALFDADLATKTTSDLAEGSNLYFTDSRAQDALASTISDINGDIAQEVADRIAADSVLQDNIDDEVTARGIAVSGVQSNLTTHINNNVGAHSATAISNTPFGNLSATTVQGALNELQTDVDSRALDSALTAHIDNVSDAHDASAISYDNTDSGLAAITVQDAIDEVLAEAMAFPLKAPTGSLSDEPSYGFTGGDDDTGMFSTGDGNVSFKANGFLRLYIEQNESTFVGNLNVDTINGVAFPQTGTANKLASFDSSGDLISENAWTINSSHGLELNTNIEPNGGTGGPTLMGQNVAFRPLQDTPGETWNVNLFNYQVDPDDSGFEMGVGGQFANIFNIGLTHEGTSDLGATSVFYTNLIFGNGTDPISVGGISLFSGLGVIRDNVTVTNQVQGYGFQYNVEDGATLQNQFVGFYDYTNIDCSIPGYQSASFSPTIVELQNNSNYNGLNINPTIDLFTGNAGFNGIAIGGNLGDFNTGGYNGIIINPTIGYANSAYGIWVSMDNVSPAPGAPSFLTFQDLYFEFAQFGDNNSFSMLYINDGTAGSETVSLNGTVIEVHMESGVSTADQIKAAIESTPGINSAVTITVSGVGTNPQILGASSNFSGGINPGNVKAAYFDGDVEITGDLSFGGDLNIGRLNAFGPYTPVDGGGNPGSVHSLISQITVPDNSTINNVDTFGVNTAMLTEIGDNCTLSSGFLKIGMTALGLPAVFKIGANSYLDALGGAIFALSIDGTSDATAVVDQAYAGRFLPIPGGPTTFNRFYGMWSQQPAGLLATKNWGVYSEDAEWNYFEGAVKIGGGDEPGAGLILDVEGDTRFNGNIVEINSVVTNFPTSQGAAGSVLTNDSAGNLTWEPVPSVGEPGDIPSTSFSAANNVVSPSDVTGLAFANGVVGSFEAQVRVVLDATTDAYETITLNGIQKASSWAMSVTNTGDNTGVTFSITNSGQVQYTSSNAAGFVSLDMKFRAWAVGV